MSTPPSPGGTDALFGVVQTALTIGSAVPLLLSLVALVLFVRMRRRLSAGLPGTSGTRRLADDSRRLHDLARVSLLGSAFGLVLLVVGQIVVGLGTPAGPAAAFAGPRGRGVRDLAGATRASASLARPGVRLQRSTVRSKGPGVDATWRRPPARREARVTGLLVANVVMAVTLLPAAWALVVLIAGP